MIIKRSKNFSNKDKEDLLKGVGIAGIGVGGKLILDSNQNGEISGRVKLYHGTSKKAKEKILEEGLLGKHALDDDNLTNKVLNGMGKKDGRPLVYTGKKKYISKIMMEIKELEKGLNLQW